MRTEELDCVPIRYNPKISIWVQDETLYGRMDIARDELRGNRLVGCLEVTNSKYSCGGGPICGRHCVLCINLF